MKGVKGFPKGHKGLRSHESFVRTGKLVADHENSKAKRFGKGHIPWNKGLKGIHLSPTSEFKRGDTTKEKNVNWKGGITPLNTAFRMTWEYKQWRKAVFERDNYTCQECGARGVEIHADHIKEFAYYPELRLDINNGRTLCVPCHKKTPSYLVHRGNASFVKPK